ncbi:hypothetical protein V8B55DRAFT_1429912 [Mucor lusitanicus]|uniref:Uncharacterized protein n=2 Tax=Mucor circinelloides f. lusitanicus TaxID=29924 RepID=A0A162QG40_MUCCL|nr:hypothetical protein FB192DRAFT_1441496 [Mucor lusitanicus]OAD01750.1 hypothetical protein MUCCIDRAFT_111092 [Mucor lusitanicus CBS 277.49]
MTLEAYQIIVREHPQLRFLRLCVDMWPILGLIAAKWTHMTNHHRRNIRIGQQAIANHTREEA